MEKQKSLKLNFVYNVIMMMLNLLFPLITAPYISKVLGAENIGKVNYANAISNWFILIASYGIPTFGIREIATKRNDKDKLSKAFWDLIIIKAIFSIIALGIYTLIVLTSKQFMEDRILYLLMNVAIFLNIFSIDWFYQGIEEYGYITLRNLIIKIISLALIFISIRKSNDYIIYATISIFALTFSNVLNYINVRKYISFKISKINFKYYLINLRVFFMSSIVISIYSQLDQVMLGWMSDKKSVAFYVRSRQIVNIGITLTNALSTVLIPKLSYLFKENKAQYKSLLQKSVNYIYLISLPATTGIFMLSKEITYLFGGSEFLPAAKSIAFTSSLVILVSIGTWQYNQIFLPTSNEKIGLKIQIIIAIISLSLNFMLIPKLSYIGTCISIVTAETIGTIFGAYYIRKKESSIKIKYLTRSLFIYISGSIGMGLFIYVIRSLTKTYYQTLFTCLIFAPLVYGFITIVFRDKIIIDTLRMLLKKFNRSNV